MNTLADCVAYNNPRILLPVRIKSYPMYQLNLVTACILASGIFLSQILDFMLRLGNFQLFNF